MKFVCFGEIMGRLNPEGYNRFVQAKLYEMSYAGGEANVAVSLANYGQDVSFVTKLPDNDISKTALRNLKAHDVDAQTIEFTELASKGVAIKTLSYYQNELSRLNLKVYEPENFKIENFNRVKR